MISNVLWSKEKLTVRYDSQRSFLRVITRKSVAFKNSTVNKKNDVNNKLE